jgi:hypothetical protein
VDRLALASFRGPAAGPANAPLPNRVDASVVPFRWDGDTLVVDTVGFNDKTWLDINGTPHTDMLHVVERYHRADLGHLDLEMRVEDPGALSSPWIVKRNYILWLAN